MNPATEPDAGPQLTTAQAAEVARLKMYFPFRICYGALSPSGEFESGAMLNRRHINKLVREGWKVWQATR